MIINDKALARTLKRSGKTGFKICINGYAARVVSWDWAAKIPLSGSNEPPKLTLAALVELLGYIPGDGECGHVYKTKSGWEWQSMTEAVFDIEYNQLARKEAGAIGCLPLPIGYGGPLILTTEQKMYRVTGPSSLVADRSRMCFKQPGSLCFGDYESELYITCSRPDAPWGLWKQLENLDWEATENETEN